MHPDSLDTADPWGGPPMAEALVSPDAPIERLEELVCLNEAIQELEPDDREMLYRRYFREETQAELGERFGISQMQVSRRLSRILVWLQRRLLAGGGSGRASRPARRRAEHVRRTESQPAGQGPAWPRRCPRGAPERL